MCRFLSTIIIVKPVWAVRPSHSLISPFPHNLSVTEDGLTAETGLTIKRFKRNWHIIHPTHHLYILLESYKLVYLKYNIQCYVVLCVYTQWRWRYLSVVELTTLKLEAVKAVTYLKWALNLDKNILIVLSFSRCYFKLSPLASLELIRKVLLIGQFPWLEVAAIPILNVTQ